MILRDCLSHARTYNLTAGQALAKVVEAYVLFIEDRGGDVTDDDVEVYVARKVRESFLRSDRRAG